MARKPRGAKVPIGEIEKVAVSLGKTLGGTAMKGLKALASSASKPAKKAAPRKAPAKKAPARKAAAAKTPAKKAPAKKAPAVKAPAKKAPSSVRASKADKGVSPTGRPIGRVAATPPPRPRRDYYRKDAILPQDASSQRAAERQANRILRRADGPSAPTPRGNTQPVNVKGSIVTPPRKAYLQDRSKPSSSSYEADTFRGQQRADARSIGRGQPRRRKRK